MTHKNKIEMLTLRVLREKHTALINAKDDSNVVIRSIGRDYAANRLSTNQAWDELERYMDALIGERQYLAPPVCGYDEYEDETY